MQVARCVGPPGAAGHPHRAEHRRKVAHVVVLHLPMTGPVGVGDWAGAALGDGVPLPHRAQVQVVLEQQPRQLPAARLQVASSWSWAQPLASALPSVATRAPKAARERAKASSATHGTASSTSS